MTYEKIFADVKKVYAKADKSKLNDDFAFQFNITGEGEGIFYVAFRGGILEIAPYDYVDRCATLYATGENFIKLATKKFSLEEAVRDAHISIEGNYDLALVLDNLASAYVEKEKTPKKPKAAPKTSAAPKAKKPAAPKRTATNCELTPEEVQPVTVTAVKLIPGETDLA